MISTLEAYFLGRKELFSGLKIEEREENWETYPVFRIDFANGSFHRPEDLVNTLDAYLNEWELIY